MDPATQMASDGLQAFGMIGDTLWTLLRLGAMIMAMPLIGTRAVPSRIKLLLSATLAIALAPILPPVPSWVGFDAATVLTIFRELVIGITIGFMLRLVFEAGALAGELIAQGTGLSFAQMADPMRGGSSGVIGQWFYLMFGLLFFTANGHLALISLLVDSYRALPIGTTLPDPAASVGIAPTFLLTVLRGGVGLALPLIVAMLAVNLAFGALARAAPALNPIQLGLPVSLLLGLALLAVLAGEMGPPVQRLFDAAFEAAGAVVR
ncbi:flagellar biosynthetic protein FliR [Stenotrophomonas sp. Betaine-02u-21]|uniref:flagellar biosynthetic protein FliR n=1 Tax=unclassified Stenotrophomonas TaxID=196198 RepID=UPI000C34B9A7|nr:MULTISPECIES: flagellar biosynthetic protein FliR [unclassified Stenotrophomonas]PKH70345.1 flagellar biosynthetic protein FliR [Stenotrophomonas sp. Betaine-02u-23]PKH74600.1 flagellar biosynthetic protein FliR [Stenotrophomonas sp. Betaine-02u-21]PKH96175.1 flagellar biosynthetic protein FliR [Stenotrophomonas sp. Bg11-02]